MSSSLKNHQNGFSLIEILIASALGIFLTAGALTIFSSNKDSYRIQQAISGTLKNSRFIIDRFERKIKGAGYSGFYGSFTATATTENNLKTPNNILWNITKPVYGYNDVSSASTIAGITNIKAGSDVLILKSMINESALISQASDSSSYIIDAASGFSASDILIVTDLDNASIFQIDSADNTIVVGETTVTVSTGATPLPGNASLSLNDFNGNNATIGKLETLIFVLKTGENGNTALFEGRLATSTDAAPTTSVTEIISNVEDMQFIYGIDTDNNGSIDKYSDASNVTSSEWAQVNTIGISLLMQSEGNNISLENNSYSFDSNKFTFTKDATPDANADKRLRQVFTTYIALKNL